MRSPVLVEYDLLGTTQLYAADGSFNNFAEALPRSWKSKTVDALKARDGYRKLIGQDLNEYEIDDLEKRRARIDRAIEEGKKLASDKAEPSRTSEVLLDGSAKRSARR